MSRYIQRQQSVDAVQVTPKSAEDVAFSTPDVVIIDGLVYVYTSTGIQHVPWESWLITPPLGELFVLDRERFDAAYEPEPKR
jgi:hypothetical protein